MPSNNSSRVKIIGQKIIGLKVIGLTGGIASGKNFVAEIFTKNGAAVFDADKEVHNLLESDKATILQVKKEFPESFVDGKIERKILGRIVFADEKKLRLLEEILHVKVRENYRKFLFEADKSGKKLVVLNIPLLLETEGYESDYVVAILASPSIRKKRFLARAKKSNPKNFAAEKRNLEKKFTQIIAKQLTNTERKSRADFVVNTSKSKAETVNQVEDFLKMIA